MINGPSTGTVVAGNEEVVFECLLSTGEAAPNVQWT